MTTASRSYATAPLEARLASGLLPSSYTTTGDVTFPGGKPRTLFQTRDCWKRLFFVRKLATMLISSKRLPRCGRAFRKIILLLTATNGQLSL